MFDWFWSFLYLISKTLFKLIDGLIQCANYLCGIEPITVDGEKIDFLQYVLTSNQIGFAFRVASLLGIIIVVVFSVIAILRTLANEKSEGTPAQIVGKAIKSILSFLFIPFIMVVLTTAGGVFMSAMYQATTQGANSLGDFLFKSFALESGVSEHAIDAFLADPSLSWQNTSDVWNLMDLGDFEFIFSWIAGGVILGAIGMSMMYFVSRVIHIAILYIAAPFSIGASILDDGARFKLWREQVLIKFITGYGMMIAINVYAMVCSVVMNPTLVFFEKGSFWDYLMKLLLIAGGGVALKQAMALVGNLISSGAGSNELRDTAIAGGLSGAALKAIPGAAALQAIHHAMQQESVAKTAQTLLPSWAQRSYNNRGGGGGNSRGDDRSDDRGSGSKNSASPLSRAGDAVKNAISGSNNAERPSSNSSNNQNNSKNNDGGGNNLVNNIINNVGNNNNNKGGFADVYNDEE